MKNLHFKYVGAWNFLPFGPEGIEINFQNYGNIVFVEGTNKDAKLLDEEDDQKISSNGSGKSSIQEIIVYALYGKTIKRPEKINVDDVVHNKTGKDCKCVVEFDKYRIVRTRIEGGKKNKNSLRLWESENNEWNDKTEITLSTISATQKKIEEIVGLTYESFINICIFTDDQRSCFLECDKNTKREIVENLLSLNVYREWFENAKTLKKETKSKIDSKSKEFSLFLSNKEDANKRLSLTENKKKNWLNQKEKEIEDIEIKIKELNKELETSDSGAAVLFFQNAQKRMEEINKVISEGEKEKKTYTDRLILVEQKEIDLKEAIQLFTEKFKDFSRETKYKLEEKRKKQEEISLLESETPSGKCNKCKGTINPKNIENYLIDLKKELTNLEELIAENAKIAKKFESESVDFKSKQEKIKQMKSQTESKIKNIDNQLNELRVEFTKLSKIKEPKTEGNELVLQQKIENLVSQKEMKILEKEGETPFDEIIKNDKEELEKIEKTVKIKEIEIKDLEKEILYFDYWIAGFGETGIRKWIIDGIIPDLNKRINYWLQFLIDNMITLSFDNELQEKIERNPPDGDPYIYYAMSTGQRRRLNLAVGHSFAYITELSSDAIPNIIFLDEVTTNVDPLGVQGIYKMIRELSETKQVFITTHDQDLIKMLDGSSKISLIHENGFTKKI